MKKKIGYAFLILLFIPILYGALNPKIVWYLYAQAKGQWKIINNTVPVSQMLKDDAIADSTKQKLIFVLDIKRFAEDSLMMTPSNNYTTYLPIDGPLMWVVTASPPYELTAHEWRFPFFGTFPYLGFFDEKMAKAEEARQQAKGQDTNIRNPGGWSTLGWFTDPIFPGFLKKTDPELAELIIHELTHGTVFVKDSIDFNENLASFIGHKGTLQYLETQGREKEKESYLTAEKNRKVLINYIISKAHQLEALYLDPDFRSLEDAKKALKKQAFLTAFINDIATLPLSNTDFYMNYYKNININNTFFLSYLRYQDLGDELEELWKNQFNQSIPEMLSYYEELD